MANNSIHNFINKIYEITSATDKFIFKNYVSAKTKIEVIHNVKHCNKTWITTPDNLLKYLKTTDSSGNFCPSCSEIKKSKVCCVTGCSNLITSKLYCAMHYARFRAHGDPDIRLIKKRKSRNTEDTIEELQDFYLEYGKFNSTDLMKLNSGLERHIRIVYKNLREFCETNNLKYMLKEEKRVVWNENLAKEKLLELFNIYKRPISVNDLIKDNIGLYQWIKRKWGNLEDFAKKMGIYYVVGLYTKWSDALAFRWIKNINADSNIKPSAEYIKKHKKGLHNYIYSTHGSFESFVNSYDLHEFVDINTNSSIGEKTIESFLIANKVIYEKQYKFDDCKNKNKLPFDFAILDNQHNLKYLLEFDGEIHFKQIEYFGTLEDFRLRQKNDKIKNEFCISKNIFLFRIPYWELTNIDDILKNISVNCKTTNKQNSACKFLVNHHDWSYDKYISQAK